MAEAARTESSSKSEASGVTKCGKSVAVVNVEGLRIDELAGNVSSKDDTLSIAYVTAKAGTAEPWLTLHYDEWICIRKGKIKFETASGSLVGEVGETIHIKEGTRFRPSFPEDAEYIPVCLPAFKPERCIREDTNKEGEGISENLKKLHQDAKLGAKESGECKSDETKRPEVLYHMTTKEKWAKAKKAAEAYYPSTFEQDGYFTHATAVPSRLIETANHFYQDVVGEWVCLEFTRSALRKCGIYVRDEGAMPVGNQKVNEQWTSQNWVCPHVIGGIPPSVVRKEYDMLRDGKKFVKITGLTE